MRNRVLVVALILAVLAYGVLIGGVQVPVARAQELPYIPDYDKDNSGLIDKTEAIAALNDYLVNGRADKELAIAAVNGYLLQGGVADLQEQLQRLREMKQTGGEIKPPPPEEQAKKLAAAVAQLESEAADKYLISQDEQRQKIEQLRKVARQQFMVSHHESSKPEWTPQPTPEPSPAPYSGPAPVITSCSPDHGQPGDLIAIEGQNFPESQGPSDGVKFLIGDDCAGPKWVWGKIEYWTPTAILVEVPDTMGPTWCGAPQIDPFEGWLIVQCYGKDSNLLSFRWEPTIEMQLLLFMNADHYTRTNTYCLNDPDPIYSNNYSVVQMTHATNLLACGASLDDEYFVHIYCGSIQKLTHNWVVDHVEFSRVYSERGEADACVAESYPGTDNPYVRVHWWVTAYDWVNYTLSVWVRGPAHTAPCQAN
jgi:hypothetical protein